MGTEEIFEKVKAIIVEQLGSSESSVTLESSFIDDLKNLTSRFQMVMLKKLQQLKKL